MPPLCDLRPGQRGRIDRIEGGAPSDTLTQRLMEMGVLEGETVEVVRFAPLGDPLEIRLNDYFLSLRKADAARVQVTLL